MLSRFFKPRWQHASAQVRRSAIEQLGADDYAVVVELARTDPDAEVRCVALARIADADLLQQILASDTNPRVRSRANERLFGLICGSIEGLAADRCHALLDASDDNALVEHVARHGQHVELRLRALERVQRQPLLCELVSQDNEVMVQLAALQRIERRADIETLCKDLRGHDKRVYRAARDRIIALREAEERPRQIEAAYSALCARLEALTQCAPLEGDETALAQMQQQWQALAEQGAPNEEQLARFAEGVVTIGERVAARVAKQAAHTAAVEALCARAEALHGSPQASLEADIQALESDWQALEMAVAGDAQTRFETALAALKALPRSSTMVAAARDGTAAPSGSDPAPVESSGEAGVELDAGPDASAASNAATQKPEPADVLAELDALLARPKPPKAAQYKAIERRWSPDRADAEQQQRYADGMQELDKRRKRQQASARDKLVVLSERVGQLEQALDDGRSADASALQKKVHGLEKSLRQLDARLPDEHNGRMQRLAGRLKEMLDWQRFSNAAERKQLCEDVEALIGKELPPRKLARRVKDARKAWNALGSTDRDALKTLRKRFNTACDKAFAPCAEFFEQEARERAANLAERTALCERMEAFIADTDWDSAELRDIERFQNQARDKWKAMGAVDRDAFGPIAAQYRAAGDTIGAHLRKRRAANLLLKQALVREAEALVDGDLDTATTGIKALQARWKTLGPAPRREDQALWKRLSAAGDAIFGRRNAERQVQRDQQKAGDAQRSAICDELEAALADAKLSPRQLQAQLAALDTKWTALAEPAPTPRNERDDRRGGGRGGPREQSGERHGERHGEGGGRRDGRRDGRQRAPRSNPLEQRYQKLQAAADAARKTRRRNDKVEHIKRLGQAASLLAQRQDGDAAALADIEAQWQALLDDVDGAAGKPYLDSKLLQQAWQRAVGDGASDQADVAADLCLRMEVLAGVESPAEAAGQRMALQVERLQAGLGDQGDDGKRRLDDAVALEGRWWQQAALPAGQAQTLTRRFLVARDAFYRDTGLPL